LHGKDLKDDVEPTSGRTQAGRPAEPPLQARAPTPAARRGSLHHALSFIRTVTVGPGFAPGLLDPGRWPGRALAGWCRYSLALQRPSPPVGSFAPP